MADLKIILSSLNKNLDNAKRWQRYLAGIFFILCGAALRIWPLGDLGTRVPWLTFYPTVMIAALFGGLYVGLCSTFLTCIISKISKTNPVFGANLLEKIMKFRNKEILNVLDSLLERKLYEFR